MQSFGFYVKNPRIFMVGLLFRFGKLLPDKLYLTVLYRLTMGKKLDLKNPRTFNEKLQWLKLYYRKPEFTNMVDKFAVKKYVENRIGKEYVIPTLGIWNSSDDIDWDCLPNQFVLKTTHGSGGHSVSICKDKEKFDIEAAKTKMEWSLKCSDTYIHYKEWPYKNVKKRIIAEEFINPAKYAPLGDAVDFDLKDYKFFCFNGKVRCFKVDFGRFTNHHANYYSPLGEILPFGETCCTPDFLHKEILPENLSKMIELAEKLSFGLPFIRVDLYNIYGKIYFGELTFFPAGGVGAFTDQEWDRKLGDWLELPQKKKLV